MGPEEKGMSGSADVRPPSFFGGGVARRCHLAERPFTAETPFHRQQALSTLSYRPRMVPPCYCGDRGYKAEHESRTASGRQEPGRPEPNRLTTGAHRAAGPGCVCRAANGVHRRSQGLLLFGCDTLCPMNHSFRGEWSVQHGGSGVPFPHGGSSSTIEYMCVLPQLRRDMHPPVHWRRLRSHWSISMFRGVWRNPL